MNEKIEKKVSFRVRRIYYDQFVAGTKHEEFRALKPYWVKILRPYILVSLLKKISMSSILKQLGFSSFWSTTWQPRIVIISCPGQPTLQFRINSIWIDESERILGRKLSDQGKKDIPIELCIVTKMGEQIEMQKNEL